MKVLDFEKKRHYFIWRTLLVVTSAYLNKHIELPQYWFVVFGTLPLDADEISIKFQNYYIISNNPTVKFDWKSNMNYSYFKEERN